jgi:Arc/MetJ-type ribon-helix-helix transcriptional regulator
MFKTISVSITKEQAEWLKKQKEAKHLSKSIMVRQALDLLQNGIQNTKNNSDALLQAIKGVSSES